VWWQVLMRQDRFSIFQKTPTNTPSIYHALLCNEPTNQQTNQQTNQPTNAGWCLSRRSLVSNPFLLLAGHNFTPLDPVRAATTFSEGFPATHTPGIFVTVASPFSKLHQQLTYHLSAFNKTAMLHCRVPDTVTYCMGGLRHRDSEV
jgi:hypothetical protein